MRSKIPDLQNVRLVFLTNFTFDRRFLVRPVLIDGHTLSEEARYEMREKIIDMCHKLVKKLGA